MASCALQGGCPSDYIALAVSAIAMIVLLARSTLPFVVHKIPCTKGSGFWLLIIQIFASFDLLFSMVMGINILKIKKRHWWQSCYIWAVWFEGPFGFALLLSCRIVQAFQLYHIFAKRRLPPIRSYILLPLILLPWIAGAAFIHVKKPLNPRCHLRGQWIIPVVCLHALYIVAMVFMTWSVQHIKFRFHEFKDLLQGVIVSAASIGAAMEVNISHRTRQEILGTPDLAHPDLFNNAISELMQLMKTNLGKDYWSSTFFMKFKEESRSQTDSNELMERVIGWDISPRLSSVHGADDPFGQEPPSKGHRRQCDSHNSDSW